MEGLQSGEGEAKCKGNRVRKGRVSGRQIGKMEGKRSEEGEGKWKGVRVVKGWR